MPLDVEILLFDGFDELDAVGPYEVLANGAREGADLAVSLVTHEPAETVTAGHGLAVVPQGTLGDPDLLVVPGGGWTTDGGVAAVVEDGTLPEVVAAHHEDGATIASVCTGAMVLAAGGVLDGRPATTHHVAREDLAAVADRVDARVVDDGDVVTAGGVTAGIDLALWLLEREFGAEVADGVARTLEHDRSEDVHRA
jgi:transcriptional regulator GlxA family with amidase domain